MRAKNRREFLKSSAATICAAGFSGVTTAEAASASGFLAKPDGPPIQKGLVMSMLPEKLSMADRFKLARDTGFEVIQEPTTPGAKQAEEIKAAADASGVRVDSVMNMAHWKYPLSSADPAVVNTSMEGMLTRRDFLEATAVGAAGLAIKTTAKSYRRIIGANNRLNFAVIGLNGRAYAHLSSLKANTSAAHISHVCDVDSNILKKFADAVQREMGEPATAEKDFRNILELKDVDAITIATPDHWHTPMAIAGLQAGKHIYVEKPCSHNPAEGAMLIEAQQKYGKLVQMGTQQRSSPHTIEVVERIHAGSSLSMWVPSKRAHRSHR